MVLPAPAQGLAAVGPGGTQAHLRRGVVGKQASVLRALRQEALGVQVWRQAKARARHQTTQVMAPASIQKHNLSKLTVP